MKKKSSFDSIFELKVTVIVGFTYSLSLTTLTTQLNPTQEGLWKKTSNSKQFL
ncbi:MAG TPA: hypothetical protein VGK25_13775 [Ignavibacteria bacterium]|jgi:hypothetical protein